MSADPPPTPPRRRRRARALALARDVLAHRGARDRRAGRAARRVVRRRRASGCSTAAAASSCRGIGKSGHVARKLAATLASTGTPAFFVHPAEASHGDLGMITPDDVVVDAVQLRRDRRARRARAAPQAPGRGAHRDHRQRAQSSLAQAADVHLDAAVDAEACPLGLAPTASTTAALALGDALALALLDARGFSADDFARSHPGGTLGRALLRVARRDAHRRRVADRAAAARRCATRSSR